MKLHLSRFTCLDLASNLRRMEAEATQAAEGGAELVVFPEGFLTGYTQGLDPALARERFRALSAAHPRTAFLFGTLTEEGRNRLTVWQEGRERARYDKVHLFQPNGEDLLWSRGDAYAALRLGAWTLGLLTCNDLRFPEQARALALAGADLLLCVAWWPWRRDEVFGALLRARAIENGCFAAGCCIAACEAEGERFAGAGNHVFDPTGAQVPTADDHTYRLERARLAELVVDTRATHVAVDRVTVYP